MPTSTGSESFPVVERGPEAAAGVFETVRVDGGVPLALAGHLLRLARSCARLYGIAPGVGDLRAAVRGALRGMGRERPWQGRLRVTARPGGPLGLLQFRPESLPRPGATVPRPLAPLVVPGGWGEHKWRDRGPLARGTGGGGLLVLDDGGEVLETDTGNVFVVRGGRAATPPLDGRILPGLTRGRLLGLLTGAGVAVAERRLGIADLALAEEVFFTSSVQGVQSVSACEGVGEWRPGPLTRRAGALLAADWERERAAGLT